jgi:hypothetical protein
MLRPAFFGPAARAAGVLLSLIALAGCGDENPLGRLPVTGTVSLDGKPLERGSVSFEPLGGGTSSGSTIAAGEFAIREEKGLPPGRYRVRVYSASAETAPEDQLPGESGPPHKDLIPKTWNANSEQQVEVTEGGENAFNFDIKTSG